MFKIYLNIISSYFSDAFFEYFLMLCQYYTKKTK